MSKQMQYNNQIIDFEFRPITEDMLSVIDEFYIHLFGKESVNTFMGFSHLQTMLEGRHFKPLILFSKKNNKIAGISTITKYGYIYAFGVHSKYRRMGLGKLLLECSIACMIDMKVQYASLHTNTNNIPAIALYKKYGFKVTQTLKGMYDHDELGPDAYRMQMPIEGNDNNERVDRFFDRKEKINTFDFDHKQWKLIHTINSLIHYTDTALM